MALTPEIPVLGLDRLSMNLGTLGPGRAADEVLDSCARAGIRTITPWRYNYEAGGISAFARSMRRHGLVANSVCRIARLGGADTPPAWRNAIEEGRAVLDEAAELGARSVTLIGGGLAEGSRSLTDARARLRDGVQQLAGHARSVGVALAVEPLHPMVAADRGCISTLAQALEMAEQAGNNVGIMFDCYNSWWDPALPHTIPAAASRLLGFQVADWLVPTTDLVLDRGLMGDGVIDFRHLRGLAEAAGYTGFIEVEILSSKFWKQDADSILQQVTERFLAWC
jgi:sugar phosphate isomerase/epimerase